MSTLASPLEAQRPVLHHAETVLIDGRSHRTKDNAEA